MKQVTIPVTFRKKTVEMTFVDHEGDWESYKPVWDESEADTVWYEKLGFHARGVVHKGVVHIYEMDRKLVGHEMLHKFDIGHPNTPLASIIHAVESGLAWSAFSGLFRWIDWHGIGPEADRVIKALMEAEPVART